MLTEVSEAAGATSGNFWEFAGVAVTALVALATAWVVQRNTSKPPDAAPPKIDPETQRDREDVAQAFGKETANAIPDALAKVIATQQRSIDRMERRTTSLIIHVVPLVEWIDTGSKPPPPLISAALRDMIRDHYERPPH